MSPKLALDDQPSQTDYAKPVIGITIGDPAGIGPEIIQACLNDPSLPSSCNYRIIGSPDGHQPGRPTSASARAAWDALEEASTLLSSRVIHGVVTAPISKESLNKIGFPFPGHTEFFASHTGTEDFAMCLTGASLTVALTTIHVPLRDVPKLLRTSEIIRVGRLLARFMTQKLGRAPHIAVAGLNPHAGENGQFGDEEKFIISPAIDILSSEGDFSGPHSPDTVFYRATTGEFDAVLCMYHDQGLIPLKLLAFDTGVNTTLGLPFPRTSPDHGTAFNIAGTGKANPASMAAAIRLAADLVAAKMPSLL